MARQGGAELKAAYSIPELAEMMNRDRHWVRRWFEAQGARLDRNGRAITICLSEIRRAWPAAWESIQDLESARESLAANDDASTDDEDASEW